VRLWSSSSCQGRASPQAGAKNVINVLREAPIQPCSPGGLPPPPNRTQHCCLGQLRVSVGPGALLSLVPPSPLHFNTPLHLWLVCTAHNVPSIISVCTFAAVCASCTSKAIKSSLVCLRGNHIFFPSPDKPALALKDSTNRPCKP